MCEWKNGSERCARVNAIGDEISDAQRLKKGKHNNARDLSKYNRSIIIYPSLGIQQTTFNPQPHKNTFKTKQKRKSISEEKETVLQI